jgi:membrane-associated phospholipid phosphatase
MFWSRTFLATWACLAQLGAAQMLAFTTWPTHIYQGKPATVTWLGAPDVVRKRECRSFPSDHPFLTLAVLSLPPFICAKVMQTTSTTSKS